MPHRRHEGVQQALLRLISTPGMTWPKIALAWGIPAPTLWDIASGKPVPRKWRRRLGLRVSRDLYAMPVKDLRWSIDNREEI